jgi:hypothetical protein
MIFRKAVFFLAAVAVAATTSAHAQVGVYGMFTVDRLSNLQSSPLLPTPAPKVDPVNPLGGTGGVYYDFLKLGPVKLGADLRGSILTTKRGAYVTANAGGTRIYSALGGVRAAIHTPLAPLKPYIQFSAGLGRSDYGLSRTTSTGQIVIYNNFQYEGLAGLDVRLLPIMDWRVAEFGYGGLDPFGSLGHNYPIKQVSMGFVFHLP